MTDKHGVLICGHGTRAENGLAEFRRLSQDIQAQLPAIPLRYGYLEFARPIITEGLDALRQEGCTTISALPAMLFAAGHVKNDIPSILKEYQNHHPSIKITLARELALTPDMLNAAAARIQEALSGSDIPANQSLLMVVGRGASDSDANGDVAKLTRMLCEGLGCVWSETAYSGLTFPLVQAALTYSLRLGFPQIIVLPYFLFDGVLVQRIYQQIDTVIAQTQTKTRVLKAPYLNNHPSVVATFLSRLREIDTPENAMNCQLCKYRAPVIGFENEVHAEQKSHHHHAEAGASAETHHHHSHPPYPQAHHPLGPDFLRSK